MREAKKNKPVKFKVSKDSSVDRPKIEVVGLDDPLGSTKMTEALGTPDSDLQSFILNQVLLTFKGAASSNGQNQENPLNPVIMLWAYLVEFNLGMKLKVCWLSR